MQHVGVRSQPPFLSAAAALPELLTVQTTACSCSAEPRLGPCRVSSSEATLPGPGPPGTSTSSLSGRHWRMLWASSGTSTPACAQQTHPPTARTVVVSAHAAAAAAAVTACAMTSLASSSQCCADAFNGGRQAVLRQCVSINQSRGRALRSRHHSSSCRQHTHLAGRLGGQRGCAAWRVRGLLDEHVCAHRQLELARLLQRRSCCRGARAAATHSPEGVPPKQQQPARSKQFVDGMPRCGRSGGSRAALHARHDLQRVWRGVLSLIHI